MYERAVSELRKYKRISYIANKLYKSISDIFILDMDLIRDLSGFTGLSEHEVIRNVKNGANLQYDLWNRLNPKTDEEILNFYYHTPFNIYSLSRWHMSLGQRKWRTKLLKHCKGKILDYGGGIGDMTIKLSEIGLETTYGDVKGLNMEFAEYRFKRRNLKVIVLDLINDAEKLEEYDTILCLDVIEHIPNPEIILTRIANHLKIGGTLIITQLNCSGGTPCHLRMNFDGKGYLRTLGLRERNCDWLWEKKI